jgi:phospholipid N-methyltransferase
MDKQEILEKCTIDGLVIKLPNIILERKLYLDVSKTLELIGGKWNRKNNGFVFSEDPSELLKEIINSKEKNLKKEYQFFSTPKIIADYMVELAEIGENHLILEPSAGQGAIIESVLRKCKNANIFAIEMMPTNSIILSKKGFAHELGDFLKIPNQPIYDRIIANPPFSKNQDIDHIKHMYSLLKYNGILVSISSTHWEKSNNRKEKEFRNWLKSVDAKIEKIDSGSFKESGTNVASNIIKIKKLI